MSASLEAQARQTIARGSRSFAVASRLFDARTRRGATLLYLWCRHCDDVVDGQTLGHGQDAALRGDGERSLRQLRICTAQACHGAEVDEPPFAALQEVVTDFQIPACYPSEHLDGFAMDVAGRRYLTLRDTLDYCYHVAGVVGIMMTHIMGARDPDVLDRACDLGLAFQLTNIARDLVEDAGAGRCYVPEAWLAEAGLTPETLAAAENRDALAVIAARLVDTAEDYYASARLGIAALPPRSAWAVATAHDVYRAIGLKVKASGPRAWDQRVSTSTIQKLQMLGGGAALAYRSRGGRAAVGRRPRGLWQRPVQTD